MKRDSQIFVCVQRTEAEKPLIGIRVSVEEELRLGQEFYARGGRASQTVRCWYAGIKMTAARCGIFGDAVHAVCTHLEASGSDQQVF